MITHIMVTHIDDLRAREKSPTSGGELNIFFGRSFQKRIHPVRGSRHRCAAHSINVSGAPKCLFGPSENSQKKYVCLPEQLQIMRRLLLALLLAFTQIHIPQVEARELKRLIQEETSLRHCSSQETVTAETIGQCLDGRYYDERFHDQYMTIMIRESQKRSNKKTEERRKKFAEKWGTDLIQQSLPILHRNLVRAIFVSDYYLACLREDQEWFEENVTFPLQLKANNSEEEYISRNRNGDLLAYSPELFLKVHCEWHLFRIRNQVHKYPLMRTYLTISQYRGIGERGQRLSHIPHPSDEQHPSNFQDLIDSDKPYAMRDYLEEQTRQKLALSHYHQNKHFVQHTLPKLVKMPLISIEEVMAAEQMLDRNRRAQEILSEKGEIPEDLKKDLICPTPSDPRKVDISCYENKYYELLFGSLENNMESSPILGFITSENPTDRELEEGIRRMRESTAIALNWFRYEYFIHETNDCHLPITEWNPETTSDCLTEVNSYSLGGYSLRDRDFQFDNNLMIFKFFSGRLKNEFYGYKHLKELIAKEGQDPDFVIKEMIELGYTNYERRRDRMQWIGMALLMGAAIGSAVIFKTVPGKILSAALSGAGMNIYFVIVDIQAYNEILEIGLYRPDGQVPNPIVIEELKSLKANRIMSILTFPL